MITFIFRIYHDDFIFRSILYERFVYTLILTTFFNYAPESVLKVYLDPVEHIIIEIQECELAISEICKGANNALKGFFMAALTSNPLWNLALSKFYF